MTDYGLGADNAHCSNCGLLIFSGLSYMFEYAAKTFCSALCMRLWIGTWVDPYNNRREAVRVTKAEKAQWVNQ